MTIPRFFSKSKDLATEVRWYLCSMPRYDALRRMTVVALEIRRQRHFRLGHFGVMRLCCNEHWWLEHFHCWYHQRDEVLTLSAPHFLTDTEPLQ